VCGDGEGVFVARSGGVGDLSGDEAGSIFCGEDGPAISTDGVDTETDDDGANGRSGTVGAGEDDDKAD
jgi:hypothetical protein